jgi:hypothetical protein
MTTNHVPVIGALSPKPGTPEAVAALREMARMNMTMCETILYRGDTDPGRRDEIRAYLDIAAECGISVLLEPTWEPDVDKNPEACAIASNGLSSTSDTSWGGFCYRNPWYLERLAQFVEEVCSNYMDHPAILKQHGRPVLAIGHEMQYQLTKEDAYGKPLRYMLCYCPHCVDGFRAWQSEQHRGDIEKFNATHTLNYTWFGEIDTPREPEPDRVLWQEWSDYHAMAIPDAIRVQREMIEQSVEDVLVTHEINDWYPNAYDSVFAGNNFWMMGNELEHVFNDQYPMEWAPGSAWRIYLYTYTQDATASCVDFEMPFWTNGQAFGAWQGPWCEPPLEGHFEQVYSALIHGANGLFWWTGGEMLLGTEAASRDYRTLIERVGDTRPEKDPIALLNPWTAFAQTLNDDRSNDLMSAYQLLSRLGYQIEIVDEGQVIGGVLADRGYRTLCTWGNSCLLPEARERIEAWTHAGGILLADYGDTDTAPYTPVFPETITGELASRVYDLPDGSPILVRARAQKLADTADEVIARFDDGSPAIASWKMGDGTLVRCGSLIGVDYAEGMGLYDWHRQDRVRIEPAVEDLFGGLLTKAGIVPLAHPDNPAVEAGVFKMDGETVVIAVNHNRHPSRCAIDMAIPATKATDVFTGDILPHTREDDRTIVTVELPSLGGRAFRLV